jgi:hypothetical protein
VPVGRTTKLRFWERFSTAVIARFSNSTFVRISRFAGCQAQYFNWGRRRSGKDYLGIGIEDVRWRHVSVGGSIEHLSSPKKNTCETVSIPRILLFISASKPSCPLLVNRSKPLTTCNRSLCGHWEDSGLRGLLVRAVMREKDCLVG